MSCICDRVDFLRKTRVPVASRHNAAIRTSHYTTVRLCDRVQSTEVESAPPRHSRHSFQEKKTRSVFPVDVWRHFVGAKFNLACFSYVLMKVLGNVVGFVLVTLVFLSSRRSHAIRTFMVQRCMASTVDVVVHWNRSNTGQSRSIVILQGPFFLDSSQTQFQPAQIQRTCLATVPLHRMDPVDV